MQDFALPTVKLKRQYLKLFYRQKEAVFKRLKAVIFWRRCKKLHVSILKRTVTIGPFLWVPPVREWRKIQNICILALTFVTLTFKYTENNEIYLF